LSARVQIITDLGRPGARAKLADVVFSAGLSVITGVTVDDAHTAVGQRGILKSHILGDVCHLRSDVLREGLRLDIR
jgi:hypothetical protein